MTRRQKGKKYCPMSKVLCLYTYMTYRTLVYCVALWNRLLAQVAGKRHIRCCIKGGYCVIWSLLDAATYSYRASGARKEVRCWTPNHQISTWSAESEYFPIGSLGLTLKAARNSGILARVLLHLSSLGPWGSSVTMEMAYSSVAFCLLHVLYKYVCQRG